MQVPGAGWRSCCALVPGLQHSVLVVPERHVLEEAADQLAALEQEAAADPSQRIELLKFLHVSGRSWLCPLGVRVQQI